MSGASILVIDDEKLMGEFVAAALGEKHEVSVRGTLAEGFAELAAHRVDVALVDLRLPDGSGLEFLQRVRETSPGTAVIVMTAYGTVESAVEAMKNGAVDYIQKPFDADALDHHVARTLELTRLRCENENLRRQLQDRYDLSRVIGRHPEMLRVQETVKMVAPTRATVLIQGESGTGKELIARAIHFLSERGRGPLVKINCAAIPETLLESELFGHERGAFTGAYRRTAGRFELAHGGTLLLDEVSEISPGLQAKLLRVLQEKEFDRVGGERPVRVDVRIVATTNRNLAEAIAQGRFRRDLYYRLNVVPLRLPPLRERPDDIPLLVEHFLVKHCRENRMRRRTVHPEAMSALLAYPWPGNVRELENVIERSLVMVSDSEIRPEHLHLDGEMEGDASRPLGVGLNLREAERRLILDTLRAHRGNRTRASRALGISVRTMRNKLNEYRRLGLLEEAESRRAAPARPAAAGVAPGDDDEWPEADADSAPRGGDSREEVQDVADPRAALR